MRIEAYNQIASIYKTSKTGKVQQPYGVSTGRDEVQIPGWEEITRSQNRQSQKLRISGKIKSQNWKQVSSQENMMWIPEIASMLLAKYNEMKK